MKPPVRSKVSGAPTCSKARRGHPSGRDVPCPRVPTSPSPVAAAACVSAPPRRNRMPKSGEGSSWLHNRREICFTRLWVATANSPGGGEERRGLQAPARRHPVRYCGRRFGGVGKDLRLRRTGRGGLRLVVYSWEKPIVLVESCILVLCLEEGERESVCERERERTWGGKGKVQGGRGRGVTGRERKTVTPVFYRYNQKCDMTVNSE